MRFSAKVLNSLVVSIALLFSTLASIQPAHALTVQSIPAPWAFTYAVPSHATAKSIAVEPTRSFKHADAKRSFS